LACLIETNRRRSQSYAEDLVIEDRAKMAKRCDARYNNYFLTAPKCGWLFTSFLVFIRKRFFSALHCFFYGAQLMDTIVILIHQETKGEIAVNNFYGEDFNSIRHSAAIEFTLNEPPAPTLTSIVFTSLPEYNKSYEEEVLV